MGGVLTQASAQTSAAAQSLAGVWALRAQSERVQERRFARLARQLEEIGGEPAVVALARQAELDERLHKRLCADMALTHGAALDPLSLPEDAFEARWPVELPLADRVLYEIVASCCLMESLNATLLLAMHDAARARGVRRLVHRILKDEVRHSRIGWAHLAAEQGRRDCAKISSLLPKMLADTVRDELFSPPPPDPAADELLAYGELPRERRLELFVETMESVVFPGFLSLGVDVAPGRIWLEAKLAGKVDKMAA